MRLLYEGRCTSIFQKILDNVKNPFFYFSHKSVSDWTDILKLLVILCRKTDNIPLISSMDFIRHVTTTNQLLLHHLLEMESSFFAQKVKNEVKQKLRLEIMDFTIWSCHLLESIYDPHMRWRAFRDGLAGKN